MSARKARLCAVARAMLDGATVETLGASLGISEIAARRWIRDAREAGLLPLVVSL